MKKGLFIKIISVVLILAVLSGAAGCGSCNDNSEGGGGEQTAGITLSSETLSLTVGETATLTYTANDELSAYMPLWNSSNTVIASVNGGEVRAISEGKAEIILVLGSESVSCELTVSAAAAEEDDEEPQILIDNLPVTGRMDMYVGDTYVIEAGIYVGGMPAEGDVTAAYGGEDGVIGIDGKTVTAVKEGDAEILLTAEYEGMQVTKTLQVTRSFRYSKYLITGLPQTCRKPRSRATTLPLLRLMRRALSPQRKKGRRSSPYLMQPIRGTFSPNALS